MQLAPDTLTIESDLAPDETLNGYAVRIGHVKRVSRLKVMTRRAAIYARGDGDMVPGKRGRIRNRTTTGEWD